MKNEHKGLLKYLIIGIFLLLLFISYQLYNLNNNKIKTIPEKITSQAYMDCLKLGSDARAKACIKLITTPKIQIDFPLSKLTIENQKASKAFSCIEISGTLKNNYVVPVYQINLKISFSSTKGEQSFHYEVFTPFSDENMQIQPNSKKSFSKCLGYQTYDVLKNMKNWYFTIQPYKAKIYEK